jgi:taurine dioxygenase
MSASRARFLEGIPARTVAQYGISDRAAQVYEEIPPVRHPVVRTNPLTGRKTLFVNENFTSHIADVSDRESRAFLQLFLDHLDQPEFQVRWQ